MPITINGSGTLTGVSVGGLPDGIVDTDVLANNAVTDAKQDLSGAAKAWVNFNGTGTVAIRASYNVSSITDNGTGYYTVNFTAALTDANYAISGIAGETAGTEVIEVSSRSTTSLQIVGYATENGGSKDSVLICVSIFR